MTVTMDMFLKDFSRSLRAGLASAFIGAGMSRSSGLPTWDALLGPLRRRANVPARVSDPTVAAEYVSAELGEDELSRHILRATYTENAPSRAQVALTSLPFRRVWTTNYDQLLESAYGPRGFAIVNDSDFGNLQDARERTVIVKLHGSVGKDYNGIPTWIRDPIITRSHFESFATDRPLLWADVSANFLTSSFLFLGFSFDDPNVEVLLRLSRGLPQRIRRLPHYAIMKRPDGQEEERLAQLRWEDLDRAGIKVVEIDDYRDILGMLVELKRRLAPPGLFVAGSGLDADIEELLEAAGAELAIMAADWHLSSLSGPASRAFGRGMASALKKMNQYNPERLLFHSRSRDGLASNSNRVGTVVYHDEESLNRIRRHVLSESRAVLAVGGGVGTAEELRFARQVGLPIVALPTRGASEQAFALNGEDHPELQRLSHEVMNTLSMDPKQAGRRLANLLQRVLAL